MNFYKSAKTLEDDLIKGIINLLNEIRGNNTLILKIIEDFINKTPKHLEDLASLVKTNDKKGLHDKLHLIKVRYGYLGLHDVMNEIEAWEGKLQGADATENEQLLDRFVSLNNDIIACLLSLDINSICDEVNSTGNSVLIVDDDEVNTLILKQMLQAAGHTVYHTTNGYEATQLVREKLYNVIFIDIHMPFFSGVEATKRIRAVDANQFIVAISASRDEAEIDQCLKEGANKFLAKPIRSELLDAVLIDSLNR
jgi:CheY-like chemotaxis protein